MVAECRPVQSKWRVIVENQGLFWMPGYAPLPFFPPLSIPTSQGPPALAVGWRTGWPMQESISGFLAMLGLAREIRHALHTRRIF